MSGPFDSDTDSLTLLSLLTVVSGLPETVTLAAHLALPIDRHEALRPTVTVNIPAPTLH